MLISSPYGYNEDDDGNGNNETDSSRLIGGIDGMDSSDPNEVNDNAQANMSMLPLRWEC